jgi:hypothetical protein
MKSRWSAVVLLLLGGQAFAQLPAELPADSGPAAAGTLSVTGPNAFASDPPASAPAVPTGGLSGNHSFPGFIGFMSNPLQNIDPRAMTAIYPIFGSSWFSSADPLPDGDFQVYGPALTIALSDRLAIGLNQGAYAVAHLSHKDSARLFLEDRLDQFRGVEGGGDRSGWLNLGGFVQYTLIEDVADQFLLTAGMRWEAPSGSHAIFQGNPPAHLAGYFTVGQECGAYHVLATGGYQFPAESGDNSANFFYGNVHLDRCVCGCVYPLVEVNWTYHERRVSFGDDTHRGFFDFDNYESTGNIVTLAAGADWVIARERLEIGAVYTTVLASQHGFEANGLLVKMMLRF